jgi:hypothetical protein
MMVLMKDPESERSSVRQPRPISRPQIAPGPLADLKGLLYDLYLSAGAPTLGEITAAVDEDDDLAGAPRRDTIRRCLASSDVPANQHDVTAIVTVLARGGGQDPVPLCREARQLWAEARATQGWNGGAGETWADTGAARLDGLRASGSEDLVEAELTLGRHNAEVTAFLGELVERYAHRERRQESNNTAAAGTRGSSWRLVAAFVAGLTSVFDLVGAAQRHRTDRPVTPTLSPREQLDARFAPEAARDGHDKDDDAT